MKIFYILRGIIRGLITNKHFNLFFDWFYPSYLSTIVEGALNAFYDDDEVVHCCIKLLVELVQNRNNRIRFDTWNINGLVVFKESAKYIIKLLQLWDCLRQKPKGKDIYRSKWKFVKEIVMMYQNIIAGNYINFAICDYYNDDTFTVITQLVFTMVSSLDQKDLESYKKVQIQVYAMNW